MNRQLSIWLLLLFLLPSSISRAQAGINKCSTAIQINNIDSLIQMIDINKGFDKDSWNVWLEPVNDTFPNLELNQPNVKWSCSNTEFEVVNHIFKFYRIIFDKLKSSGNDIDLLESQIFRDKFPFELTVQAISNRRSALILLLKIKNRTQLFQLLISENTD